MKHPDDSGIAHGGPAQPGATPPALPLGVSFAGLELPVEVLRTLSGLGVREPFPIQAATLPDALEGRDVLGRGRTGSGKTLAFGLPLLTRTAGAPNRSSPSL